MVLTVFSITMDDILEITTIETIISTIPNIVFVNLCGTIKYSINTCACSRIYIVERSGAIFINPLWC